MGAIFWIDLASVIPAVIPFLIFRSEPRFALRVSNTLLILRYSPPGLCGENSPAPTAIWQDAPRC